MVRKLLRHSVNTLLDTLKYLLSSVVVKWVNCYMCVVLMVRCGSASRCRRCSRCRRFIKYAKLFKFTSLKMKSKMTSRQQVAPNAWLIPDSTSEYSWTSHLGKIEPRVRVVREFTVRGEISKGKWRKSEKRERTSYLRKNTAIKIITRNLCRFFSVNEAE